MSLHGCVTAFRYASSIDVSCQLSNADWRGILQHCKQHFRRLFAGFVVMVLGEQEASGVCDDICEHSSEDHGRVQRAGGASSPGGVAVDDGGDDECAEGC